MFAALLHAACVQTPPADPPPWGGIVAVGDSVEVTFRDGFAQVLALSPAEAAGLIAGEGADADRAKAELQKGLGEFGVELSSNPSRDEVLRAFGDANPMRRGGMIQEGDRPDVGAMRARVNGLRELQPLLRTAVGAPPRSTPRPVVAVSDGWLAYRAADGSVTHLPVGRVGSITESAARYAERTGTPLPDEPAGAGDAAE